MFDYCNFGSSVRFEIHQNGTGKIFQVVDSTPLWNNNAIFNVDRLTALEIPSETTISSVYPNPFNPITNITFGIESDSYVIAKIYDITGKEIIELTNSNYISGYHNIVWNADGHSSGMYLFVINANGVTNTKKLMLLK